MIKGQKQEKLKMSFLFGGARPANQDSLKDYQRKITGSARSMEREIQRQDAQEQGLKRQLAECAKSNKLEIATIKAKEMVRLRAHRSRLYTMKEHMTGLAQQLQTVQNSSKIQETMAQTARMLQNLNTKFDAGAVAAMLREFEKQNILMTNKQEIVDDTLDCAFEVDGEQDSTNEAVLEVLQDVGFDVKSRLSDAAKNTASLADETSMENIETRLHRLRPRDG